MTSNLHSIITRAAKRMSTMSSFRSTTFPKLKEALKEFNGSPSTPENDFRLVAQFPPPKDGLKTSPVAGEKPPPLCILDSSFNPPTKAHLHIALQGLKNYSHKNEKPDLLLLLATQNADKPSAPASFEDRLAMMCLLAEDLRDHAHHVDVGLTKHARFIDKSTSIRRMQQQIWLMGYDTVTRLMDKKYYPPNHTLDSVYDTVLGDENRVMMMVRPDEEKWGSVDEQEKFVETLDEKAKGKVDVVVGGDEAAGVSSSSVRADVKKGREEWKGMVTERVAEWITEERLYRTS